CAVNCPTTGVIVFAAPSLTFSVGAFNYDASTLSRTGTLALSCTAAHFIPYFPTRRSSDLIINSVVNGPGTLTNAAGRSLTLQNKIGSAHVVNQGTLIIRMASTGITETLTTTPASTLTVQADGFFSSAFLNITHGFTNNSLI